MKDRRDDSIATADALVMTLGSAAAAARAMRVNVATIYRWRKGLVVMEGAAVTAARAILRHPGEYEWAKPAEKETP